MTQSKPYLTISRPSPTTALYTVSTHPPNPTLPRRLLRHTFQLLRLLVLVTTLAALLLKTFDPLPIPSPTSPPPPPTTATTITTAITSHLHALQLTHLHPTPWHHLVPALFTLQALTLLLLPAPHTEHLLILRGLGIQLSSSSTTTSSSSSSITFPLSLLLPTLVLQFSSAAAPTRFIPTSQIRDIFIHEAFKGFEVRYYLGVVVEGGDGEAEDIVVVFPELLPGREVLEEVWRGARGCLFEEEGAWRERRRRKDEGVEDWRS